MCGIAEKITVGEIAGAAYVKTQDIAVIRRYAGHALTGFPNGNILFGKRREFTVNPYAAVAFSIIFDLIVIADTLSPTDWFLVKTVKIAGEIAVAQQGRMKLRVVKFQMHISP